DVPIGTTLSGFPVNPGADINNDCGNEAYVTGNGGGQAGTDDIDGGTVLLTSPTFDLSGATEPYLHFDRWFVNGGGSGNPDDSMVVIINNGITEARVDFADANTPNFGTWVHKVIKVKDFISLTANMQLIVKATDEGNGHIAEAGFDGFHIIDSALVSVADVNKNNTIKVYPNPFNEYITISLEDIEVQNTMIEIIDITGKVILQQNTVNKKQMRLNTNFPSGIYFIKIIGDNALLKTEKIIKF